MVNKPNRKAKRQTNPILSDRDKEILLFLWRHRISTLAAIRAVFFPNGTNDEAYLTMRRLRWGSYVDMLKMDGTNKRVFCLHQRGYKYLVANCLPELRTKGFRPQSQYHDLFVAAVLLGRWARNRPRNVRLVSEQEMTSTVVEEIPADVRKTMDRTPDGLWIFSTATDSRAIALEVEISPKSTVRYEEICASYTSQIFFEHVVWIVADKALAHRILSASRKHGIPRDGQHLFILQKDFEKNEWASQFQNRSMDTMTLNDLLITKATRSIPVRSKASLPVEYLSKTCAVENSAPSPFLTFHFSLGKLASYENSKHQKIL